MHSHHYIPSEFEDYSRCDICGTLKHVNPLNPEDIYLDSYWSDKHTHPTLKEQCYNIDVHQENGKTKNQFILERIPQYSEKVLEIGCAPGSTLHAILRENRASEVFGIEYDPNYARDIADIIGGSSILYFGEFPKCSVRKHAPLDTILAIDVLEHSFESTEFLQECSLLLNNNGLLFLILPLVQDDGSILDRMRHREHVHLFSKPHLRELLEETGFKNIQFDQWCGGHDSVIAYKV